MVRRWWRLVSRPSAASSSSARASSSAAHSRSKNSSFVSIAVASSCTLAPAARRWPGRPCRPRSAATRSCRRGRRARRSRCSSAMAAARPAPSSSATRPACASANACRALVGLGEQAVGALGAVAVDERLEVPGDVWSVRSRSWPTPYAQRRRRGPEPPGDRRPRRTRRAPWGQVASPYTPGLRSLRLGSASGMKVAAARVAGQGVSLPLPRNVRQNRTGGGPPGTMHRVGHPGDDRLRRGRFAGMVASRGSGRPRKTPGKPYVRTVITSSPSPLSD